MAKRRTAEQNAQMKENYRALREAGLSAKEAARLRSASPGKVNAAIVRGERPSPVSERHQRAGGGHRAEPTSAGPYGTHKGRIKDTDYKDAKEYYNETLGYDKVYHEKYAYVMTYEVEHKDGTRERKYYTILSDEKMTKSQLKNEVIENTADKSEGQYPGRLIKRSIELVEAFYNPDFD